MAKDYVSKKKKPVLKMLVYGAASTALYAMGLSHQGVITEYFTRGAWYAALPIAAAFAISFVHGNFTNYFWSVLGIEARKKALRAKPEVEISYKREQPQPQSRVRA
ncbi:MAG: hypothetical protein A2Y66_01265 [Nitrospirae bacterium RBG_13_41_22]|nr:MAG: hypothetical protein A2Y66_01265 [Nitrospirae bacterium RBG_13_41_22]